MKRQYKALVLLFVIALIACEKDPAPLTPFDMVSGKTWYLEKRMVLSERDSVVYSFIGLPTFSFILRPEFRDTGYRDSDGYVGRYRILRSADTLLLNVDSLNRGIAKSYRITHLGFNHLVVEYDMNQLINRLFFSSRL
ncbi:MAG: hypothetical protein ACKOD1_00040 [Sphingomonadales bacterium]